MSGGRLDDELVLAVRRVAPLKELVEADVALRQRGRGDWWGCCPFHQEATPSFHLDARRGFFKCFGCGAKGDAIGYVMQRSGLGFIAAVEHLAALYGVESRRGPGARRIVESPLRRPALPEPRNDEREAEARADSIAWCVNLWREAAALPGTPGAAYLRARAIDLEALESYAPSPLAMLRYHGGLRHTPSGQVLPCLVAAVQGPDGAISGLHRTFLSVTAGGAAAMKAKVTPAKMMNGACFGGAVRFSRAAPVMLLGEGIETTLSVMASLARGGAAGEGRLGFWAALSLGNIAGAGLGQGAAHPNDPNRRLPSARPDPARPGLVLPEGTREAVILEDADNKDAASADALYERAARRWAGAGLAVRRARPMPGQDFNDMALAQAGALAGAA